MWTKIKMLDTKWKVLITALIVVFVWMGVSWNNKRIYCENTVKMAETAFSEGNFDDAELYYHELAYGDCPNRPYTSTGLSMDQLRLFDLEGYNRAAREKEGGDYYSAVQTLQLYLEHPRELKEAAELLLSEVYRALSTDTGQDGARLLLDMYEVSCELSENEIPPIDTIVNKDSEIKYWYPEAIASNTNYIATMPAEFRIAVCYKLIQTNIVETCLYNQTGTLGSGGSTSSIVRMNATYEIELKNILTGETIAKHQPVYSKSPGACPQTISGTNFFDKIIGEPDFATVANWIDEQISSLK